MAEDLFLFQERVKENPNLYKEEVTQVYNHFKSLVNLLNANPSNIPQELEPTVSFLAQVSSSTKELLGDFPHELLRLLEQSATILSIDTRMVFIKGIILMNNRGQIDQKMFDFLDSLIIHLFLFSLHMYMIILFFFLQTCSYLFQTLPDS